MATVASALKLREIRKRSGLTQKEVAEMLGVSQNNYSYMENGKIKIADCYLSRLAEIFDCSTDYILGKTNGVKTNNEARIRRELEFVNFIQSGESRFEYYKQLSDEDKFDFGLLCLHTPTELAERKATLEMSLKMLNTLVFRVDRYQLYLDRMMKDQPKPNDEQ